MKSSGFLAHCGKVMAWAYVVLTYLRDNGLVARDISTLLSVTEDRSLSATVKFRGKTTYRVDYEHWCRTSADCDDQISSIPRAFLVEVNNVVM